MRELNLDTQKQNFWTEAIVKEKTVRLDWLVKHEKNTYDELKQSVCSENYEAEAQPKDIKPANPSRRFGNCPPDSKNFLQEISCIGSSIESTSSELIGKNVDKFDKNDERFPKKGQSSRAEVIDVTRDEDEEIAQISEMKPVDKNTRKLLYDGFSKEGKGRYQYLQSRTINAKPEEKYDYPHISQWEYGWKQDEQVTLKPPKHGRSRVVRDTFFRTRGVFGPQ